MQNATTDEKKPALDWQQLKTFERNGVQVSITQAVGRTGRVMMSMSMGCIGSGPNAGKTSKHVKEIDWSTAHELWAEALQWGQAFRYEQDQGRRK